jgi:c(7)-type cytochrome triheme protein
MKTLALAAAMLLLVACAPSNIADAGRPVVAAAAAAPAPQAPVKTAITEPDGAGIPTKILIPSSVGEVTFNHQLHVKDLGVKCAECHHQIDARTIDTPHPEYLRSSGINCKACHTGSGAAKQQGNPDACTDKIKQNPYSCSQCHHTNPTDIADETLSAKVVIHKQCWKCHVVEKGADASAGCVKCHSGKKTL